jgi:hypothetical protein
VLGEAGEAGVRSALTRPAAGAIIYAKLKMRRGFRAGQKE